MHGKQSSAKNFSIYSANPEVIFDPCIVILLGAPLNIQNFERIGIPYLKSHANLVIFNCTPWLGRSTNDLYHEEISWDQIETINTIKDFEDALLRYKPSYAIDFIGLGEITSTIQNLLAATGTNFVVQKSGSLPQPSIISKILWKLRARKIKFKSDINELNSKNIKKADNLMLLGIKKLKSTWRFRRSLREPDLALLAGRFSLNFFTRRAKKILWVGSQDYHIFQSSQSDGANSKIEHPYVVFVDDNLPYASDWSLLSLPAPVTPDQYYKSMRQIFKAVEEKWELQIVIAAHPSSKHDVRVKQGFCDQRLIHDCTAALVKNAQAVILHSSTAVSFAVLAKKPIFFLTSNELSYTNYGLLISTMASELGYKTLNIDDYSQIPSLQNLVPKDHLYSRYIDRYLFRLGSNERHPWQNFIYYIQPNNIFS